jgi:BirA family biotin operon repressor/biotin-[acetyl-CoA-carboxylase] ligase
MIREKVLDALEYRIGEMVSGEELARSCGVSRTAVWKAVSELRREGYEISAVTNRGYSLAAESRMLSERSIRRHLETKTEGDGPFVLPGRTSCDGEAKGDGSFILPECASFDGETKGDGFSLTVVKSIDSTNNEAKRMISGAGSPGGIPFGSIIIADAQTGGRGRRGRSFHSPAADSIYMSLILKPAAQVTQTLLVTIMAAVAVCETIEKVTEAKCAGGKTAGDTAGKTTRDAGENTGGDTAGKQRGENLGRPMIKWVNDIYIDEKKVCGILTEAVSDVESGDIESLVLGIGININVPPGSFPHDIRQIAGSVNMDPSARNLFAAELIRSIRTMYGSLGRDGALGCGGSLMASYRSRSLVTGRDVTIIGSDGSETGVRAESIADDGSLIVKHKDGKVEALRSGEVSLKIQ